MIWRSGVLRNLRGMSTVAYIPCDALKPFVKNIMVTDAAHAAEYKVLPDTSVVMGFQYRGQLSYVDHGREERLRISGVSGLRTAYRVFRNQACTGSVLVAFKAGAATHFFREPLHELFGESLSLEYFVPSGTLSILEERLSAACDDEKRVGLVEDFLLSRLTDKAQDKLVQAAMQHIYNASGDIRITDLAARLHTSASPLEKRFRSVTGATPKKFASIVRMKALLHGHKTGKLTDMAYRAGYFDQAHFIKDFKSFTGSTPSDYFKDK